MKEMIFLEILMQHLTCLSGPRCPKWVLCSLVTSQGTLDRWIYDLRATDSPFLHFFGTKMTKFFWWNFSKNVEGCPEKFSPSCSESPGIQAKLHMYIFWIFQNFWSEPVRPWKFLAIPKYGQKRQKWPKVPKNPKILPIWAS